MDGIAIGLLSLGATLAIQTLALVFFAGTVFQQVRHLSQSVERLREEDSNLHSRVDGHIREHGIRHTGRD